MLQLLTEAAEGRPVTFAEPATGGGFTATLSRLMTTVGDAALMRAEAERSGAAQIGGNPAVIGPVFRAAEANERLTRTSVAAASALEEAYDQLIARVRQQTGVVLENPERGGYWQDADRRLTQDYSQSLPTGADPWREVQRQIFREKLEATGQQFPERDALGLGDLPAAARDVARQADATMERTWNETQAGGLVGYGAWFAGALWGQRRDPIFAASLLAGPATATGRTVATRMGQSVLSGAAINAGFTAAQQPGIQAWRQEVGLSSGLGEAAIDTAMAALFGGVLAGAVQGVKEFSRSTQSLVRKVVEGRATPAEVRQLTRELDPGREAMDAPALRQAERFDEADAVAIGEPPRGISREAHDDAVRQALRFAEDPERNPPPVAPEPVPDAKPAVRRITDEAVAAVEGDTVTIDRKPASFGRFSADELGTDAASFQYKGGGDAAGVTDRLAGIERWDPTASGKVFVFERADGSRVVADGHQRLGLARRLLREGREQRILLDGFLFREADGWTPADVRALAAKKNMQEGSGTAIDAARILRERPDLIDGALPLTGPTMRQAEMLRRLSDEAFGMTVAGVIPENYAAAVGAMVRQKSQQAAVMADLIRAKPETEREARLMISDILAAGFRGEHQANLFGAAELTRSLLPERARILSTAIKTLTDDARLFGTLANRADVIEAAGNVLQRQGNQARAEGAAALGELMVRLAQRTGPVSDALNRAAQAVAEGAKATQTARSFVSDLRNLLDRDGLKALLAERELRPAVTVEPSSPAPSASAASRAIEAEAPSPPRTSEAKAPDFFDTVPAARRVDGADAVMRRADDIAAEIDRTEMHADLFAACKL